MGHKSEFLDEFVEAHTTCINDLMYFPTRNAYGLSSVAGNLEKLAALQNEFENVRSKLDDGKEKMVRLEKKVTALTQGYE
ncbi:Cell division cycle 5-like protein [Arachis hypogaea]|nr:Cell division cycle 5-like protein [Arachis hypogaea]